MSHFGTLCIKYNRSASIMLCDRVGRLSSEFYDFSIAGENNNSSILRATISGALRHCLFEQLKF